MASNSNRKIEFCFDTLPPATKKALDWFSEQKWLINSNWYLAGGTALAFQVGNRQSLDLDFFTQDPTFN